MSKKRQDFDNDYYFKGIVYLVFRVCIVFRITVERGFTIDDEITRQYRQFNTVGTQLTVRLLTRQTIVIASPIS